MFGKYFILSKNGVIQKLDITNEEETFKQLQSKKFSNKAMSDNQTIKKRNVLFLTGNLYSRYRELKSFINSTIEKNFSPTSVVSSTIFNKNSRLEKLQELFGLNLFECSDDLILRPATDFGIFTLLEDTVLKNEELPKTYYEMGLCYRLEDDFDASLLRSYSFELPDIHVILNSSVYETVKEHLTIYKDLLDTLQIPYTVAVRITENEFNIKKSNIEEISRKLNRDIFVNVVPNSIRYWETKFKFINIDKNNKQIQLSTVQVDYSTSKIFNFKSELGQNMTVIHSSPGSIQRILYCLANN